MLHRPTFILLLVPLLWSFGGLIVKLAGDSAGVIVPIQAVTAAAILFPLALPFRISRLTVGMGIIYCLTSWTYIEALRQTTAANAIILQAGAPLYAMLFSWFVDRAPCHWRDVLVAMVCGIGLWLVVCSGLELQMNSGDVLAIVSGFAFAGVTILSHRGRVREALRGIVLGNLLLALITLSALDGVTLSPSLLLLGVAYGAVRVAVPYFLFAWAAPRVSLVEVALITLLEPILGPLWVALVLHEFPSTNAIVGGALVIGALAYRIVHRARQSQRASGSIL